MFTLHACADPSALSALKTEYLQGLVAPIDGMFEAITDASGHWETRVDGELAGYFATNGEGSLLQFHVRPAFRHLERSLFDHVVSEAGVTAAEAGTIDPSFLSLCLDVSERIKVHTYLYESGGASGLDEWGPDWPDLRPVEPAELDRAVAFQQVCIGGDQDLSGWLRGYSGNLIDRRELFVLSRSDEWLGLGECRRSDTQMGVTDLGMMTHPTHRGQGWATHVLARLRERCADHGERAICSTTVDNRGAQRAIAKAGFVSRHRIVRIAFDGRIA